MRELVKDWLPPALLRWVRRRKGGTPMRYAGPYSDWAAAAAHSSGYAAENILERARTVALRVKRGEIQFERDTIPCATSEPPIPVIAGLLHAAVAHHGRLSVLDFGGALGSSYFQCRPFLSSCSPLLWGIVEQEHFVRCGKAELEDDRLRFHFSMADCVREADPNAALLSGVLHYLPDPLQTLRDLREHRLETVIIDRTPFSSAEADTIAVQHVPPSIYSASYPLRIFSRPRFMESIQQHFEVLTAFESTVDAGARVGGVSFTFGGMILRRR